MRHTRLVPRMFHRRLLLLGSVALLAILMLTVRLFRLSVVDGAHHRAEAESRLRHQTFLPTYRGTILDRHGRVVALDRPSYDVAVRYEVITGRWAVALAREQAKAEHEAEWSLMTRDERGAAADALLGCYRTRVQDLWRKLCEAGGFDQGELDRRLDAIKREVQSLMVDVWERHTDWIEPRPIREQAQAHVVLPRVTDEVAFEFRRLSRRLPKMIEVQESHRREYPWLVADVILDRSSLPWPIRLTQPQTVRVQGVADHVLGSLRDQVWAEDMKRRPFVDPETGEIDLRGYRPGDHVGSRGLEAVFEDHLRGRRGRIIERQETGDRERTEPEPGADLVITLDIVLQARVQAILSAPFGLTRVQPWHFSSAPDAHRLPMGTPLNSAAIVLDIETGEILAMVSMPTLAMGRNMSRAERRAATPWVNRPVEAIYPPGSIIKPLVLVAAISEGVHRLDEPIECTGHYFPNLKEAARCWLYRQQWGYQTHGPLLAEEALAQSCNIFFYTLADRVGIERLVNWYGRFGLGTPLDVGLGGPLGEDDDPSTWRGRLPDTDRIMAIADEFGSLKFATISMGIGQGPVTWTPAQAVNAYATLARVGIVRDATLLVDDPRADRPQRRGDLDIEPRIVSAALEGLRQSAMEDGTGHQIRYPDGSTEPIFNAPGVTVWAKTGTAEAPPLSVDTNRDGLVDDLDVPLAGLDHAWFVGLVGPRDTHRPTHALAVVVEYGGSGGRAAGPIANQIIRAMQAEGYLPTAAAAARPVPPESPVRVPGGPSTMPAEAPSLEPGEQR